MAGCPPVWATARRPVLRFASAWSWDVRTRLDVRTRRVAARDSGTATLLDPFFLATASEDLCAVWTHRVTRAVCSGVAIKLIGVVCHT